MQAPHDYAGVCGSTPFSTGGGPEWDMFTISPPDPTTTGKVTAGGATGMTICWLFLGMLAQEPAAPTGPAAYWKFDETVAGTAANQVAGAPTGAPQGGPTVSTTVPALSYNGDIGATPRSLLFDGTNDVVNVANFGTFNRVTVSVWIRRVAGGPAGRQTIVSYKESSVGGFVLSLNESNGTFNPRLWVHNGGWVFAEEAAAVAADTWVHL